MGRLAAGQGHTLSSCIPACSLRLAPAGIARTEGRDENRRGALVLTHSPQCPTEVREGGGVGGRTVQMRNEKVV